MSEAILSENISPEIWGQFFNSEWPELFSMIAQRSVDQAIPLEEVEEFGSLESGLILEPDTDKKMLAGMGIIEQCLWRKGRVTPSMVKDGFHGDPNTYIPRFSAAGKQVIMACENLFTREEHDAANEAARPEYERLLAEVKEEFGVDITSPEPASTATHRRKRFGIF